MMLLGGLGIYRTKMEIRKFRTEEMKLKKIIIQYSKEDKGYICLIPQFPNLSAWATTPKQALREGLSAFAAMNKCLKEQK